jgi:hypothetical protein
MYRNGEQAFVLCAFHHAMGKRALKQFREHGEDIDVHVAKIPIGGKWETPGEPGVGLETKTNDSPQRVAI